MTGFVENFWGEKSQGFDVLYHNMKHHQLTSKEMADFIRERANVEENYSKNMSKLAKTVSNYSILGTFAPYWQIIKSSTEKLASLHIQIVHKLNEIAKELQKYTEEQHKKQKTVKEEVSGTADSVQSIHNITSALLKAKENYNNRCYDFERLKKENATPKEIEKSEAKYKKAMEDYRSYVEKYRTTRDDFEKKMTDTCKLFQKIEEAHLTHMRKILGEYNTTCESTHHLVGQVNIETHELCNGFSIPKLIEMYAVSKGTGKEKPGAIAFEECDVSNMPTPEALPREKLKKKIRRPKKKKNDKDAESGGTPDGDPSFPASPSASSSLGATSPNSNNTHRAMPEVDEEGFTIRPQEVTEVKRDSFYSTSGDESDQEERRKIHVEIKPAVVAEGQNPTVSNSVDELKAAIGGLTLSPSPAGRKTFTNGETKSRKNGGSKPSNDLIGLDLFGPSPATTPTGGSGVLSPMTPSTANPSSNTTPGSTASGELWGSVIANADADTPPALPAKQKHIAGTVGPGNSTDKGLLPPPSAAGSNSIVPPPRPPSRNKKMRSSPVPDSLPRQDSSSSLSSMTFGASPVVGGSRGPSPLTLGMSDNIPIAAAFQECINAYFKGIDQSKCMVKITGEMMISFPAGIIQVLTSNPNPAVLTIKIQNSNKLEQVLPNKQLVTIDEAQSTDISTVYVFNMSALISLLKRQSDQNVTASYFNVDILKYQVKTLPGVSSTPLQLCTYWRCDPTVTDLRVDYRYNSSAMAKPVTLSGVQLIVPVDGGVTVMQSKPPATWSADSKRALWKLNDIQPNTDGANSLRAKFDLAEGPSKPATVAVQFATEGTTLSGIDIEIVGVGYRLSLVKKRFASGKYLSDS